MPLATDDTPTQWYKASSRVGEISLRLRQTTRAGGSSEEQTVPGKATSDRRDQRMLWVDGVGGYLVSLDEEITFGQPTAPGGESSHHGPTLAILADLSRRHAKLARTGGRYVLTPYSETTVEGKPIDGPTVLADGVRFELGSVQFRLSRPHALSASALLTIESGHRTAPAADAVLLMAESCVLGPKPHSHIRCPAWTDEAILFRGSDGLVCRATGGLLVDGKRCDGPIPIIPGQRIEGQDFALCVEEVNEA